MRSRPPPKLKLTKLMCPSGTWFSCGIRRCSISLALAARWLRGTMLMNNAPWRTSPEMLPTNSTTSVTSGCLRKMAAAAADKRAVSSSVPPGGSSMFKIEVEKSSGGTKAFGSSIPPPSDRAKNKVPKAMVFHRLATHHVSVLIYADMIGPSSRCGMASVLSA